MPVPETTLAKQVAIYALQLGRGNLVALGKLYDLTAERLIRYARTLTRNVSDAEDALQAAMCRVSQYPEQLARYESRRAIGIETRRLEAERRASEEAAFTKGRTEGLVGQIHLCQEFLNQPPTPKEELALKSLEELQHLADELRRRSIPGT